MVKAESERTKPVRSPLLLRNMKFRLNHIAYSSKRMGIEVAGRSPFSIIQPIRSGS